VKRIRKAIIPAAGLGTRFLPATKAMPKEMLPIVDKPAIQFIVEEAVASGIEDVIIVTGRSKRAIEDHFDRNYELEANLLEHGKHRLLELVDHIANLADVHYVRQKRALGLGDAVRCARKFIGDEPFAVLLADMIIRSGKPCLRQMMDIYEETQASVLAVNPVPWQDTRLYGVIDGTKIREGLYAIADLVEKPAERPPSNLAISGRYILEPQIFRILQSIGPGVAGEIQLTDALRELARQQPMYACTYEGTLYDTGDKLGFLKATVEYAYESELKEPFDRFLKDWLAKKNGGG